MKEKLKLRWETKKNDPEEKRCVAVVYLHGQYFEEEYQYIAQHITKWTEISRKDFDILIKVSNELFSTDRFLIIERPIDEQLFIKQTVEDYIEFSKNKIEWEKQSKLLREKKKLEKAKKLKEDREKQEKEVYEQLKQKFES